MQHSRIRLKNNAHPEPLRIQLNLFLNGSPPTYQRLPHSQSDSSQSLSVINIHALTRRHSRINKTFMYGFRHVERRKSQSADVYAQRHDDVIHKIHVLWLM